MRSAEEWARHYQVSKDTFVEVIALAQAEARRAALEEALQAVTIADRADESVTKAIRALIEAQP